MRRHLLGIIAALLIATGAVLWLRVGQDKSTWSMMASLSLKSGLTLGAIWLAFPELISPKRRIPPMVLIAILSCVVGLIINPRSLLFIAPVAGAMLVLQFIRWLFTPPKTKPKKQQQPKSKRSADDEGPVPKAADAHEPAKR